MSFGSVSAAELVIESNLSIEREREREREDEDKTTTDELQQSTGFTTATSLSTHEQQMVANGDITAQIESYSRQFFPLCVARMSLHQTLPGHLVCETVPKYLQHTTETYNNCSMDA